jgi:DNA-binding NarL/FixJ family response regulator
MTNVDEARVGIVAADPLRTAGLEAILNEMPRLSAAAMSLEKALKDTSLAAIVLDARSAGTALAEVLARFRRDLPALKVVVMGASLEAEHVQRAIGSGAKGYLAETADEAEIRMAMEVVLDGSVWAPRKVLARLIDAGGVEGATRERGGQDAISEQMTPREKQVLGLLKDGKANRDIASAMGIDETTVKAHLGRMLRKTGATNRVELTLRALESSE